MSRTGRPSTWTVLATVSGCILVLTVGFSILNVALADILHDLGATTAELQWILSAYIVVFASLLLSAGTIGDRFGRVKTLRIGLAAFGLASTAAAFAPSPGYLIAARAVMGVGAAIVMPMTLSVIAAVFTDPRERARAFGLWSGASAVGLALGPIAGGLILEQFWWGATFLFNAPMAALLLFFSRTLPESRDPTPARFDPLGVSLSIASMGALLFATIEAPARGWTSARTLSVYALGALLLAAFVRWESHTDHPMLEIAHLRDPRVAGPAGAAAVTMFVFTGTLLGVSIMLRTVLGYGPLATGVRFLPLALTMVVLATVSPRLAERIGTRWTVAIALMGTCAGAAIFAVFGSTSGTLPVLVGITLMGGALSLAAAPTAESIVGALPPNKAGVASGLHSSTRQSAQALGVATLGSLLSAGYRSQLHAEAPRTLSRGARESAEESIAAALDVARRITGARGDALADAAHSAFGHGVRMSAVAGFLIGLGGLLIAIRFIPSRVRARAPGSASAEATQLDSVANPSSTTQVADA